MEKLTNAVTIVDEIMVEVLLYKLKSKDKIDEKKQDSSIKERLTELQSLRDDNLITDEEFEISRKKILSSL